MPGEGLYLTQVYDETVYINSSIDLVQQNIFVGGTLAALMLLLFLRSASATLVVSLAIPISVIGAFVAMAALGRSLNVISLAGIAFAVGMVVDAAIVVLENIYRLREQGRSRSEAAYEGARQVWGAVLVSALTTVMVFIPILVMRLEVGQLFRDIAVALSVAVLLSLIVAITVVPALANRLLGDPGRSSRVRVRVPGIDQLASLFVAGVMGFTRRVAGNRPLAFLVVVFFCGAGAAFTYFFLPKLEYLPDGNRNLIFGVIVPPPGYNLATTSDIAGDIEEPNPPPLVERDGEGLGTGSAPENTALLLRRHPGQHVPPAPPPRTRPEWGELIPILKSASFREPGTFGLISQRSLFGRGPRRLALDRIQHLGARPGNHSECRLESRRAAQPGDAAQRWNPITSETRTRTRGAGSPHRARSDQACR